MKKLFVVLALLILTSVWTQGAFAMCNNKNQVANQPGDSFDSDGWCIDAYGAFTPKVDRATNSQQLTSMGAFRVPVSYDSVANTTVSFNSQQSGLIMVDSGGVTSDTLKGWGSKFILPACNNGVTSVSTNGTNLVSQGQQFTLVVSSQSFSTLDTLSSTVDTLMYSITGTGQQMGDSIKSTGQAGDSVTVVCVPGFGNTGIWVIQDMKGVWTNNGTN